MATIEEIKTILQNILDSINDIENFPNIDWEIIQEMLTRWEEIKSALEIIKEYPWENIPQPIHPMYNKNTMIRHTRCLRASLEPGGRFEASQFLRGILVLCIDEEPQSLYYCTGTKWVRITAENTLVGSYGYIIDDTPLGYQRGDLIELPVSKVNPVSGIRDDIGLGMQITDAYHAVGIIVMTRTTEAYPQLQENRVIIATWIGEPDGFNIYTNEE